MLRRPDGLRVMSSRHYPPESRLVQLRKRTVIFKLRLTDYKKEFRKNLQKDGLGDV